MKILHVNEYYHAQGGVEQYVLSVAHLLEQAGCHNAVLYCQDHPQTIRNGRWPAYLLDEPADRVASAVAAVVHAEQPDVAYVHHISSPAVAVAVSRLVPTVAYLHGFRALCPGLAKYYRRGDVVCERAFGWLCGPMHYLRRCSAARDPRTVKRLMNRTARLKKAYLGLPRVLVGSQYMRSLLLQNGFDPYRVSVLAPHFFPEGAVPEVPAPASPPTVLFAGRIELEKGLGYLLRAVARVHPRPKLVVAGEGTLGSRYQRLADELGLGDSVRFVGWLDRDDLDRAHRSSALVAMPSIWPEPFGKTGVEALAHGRPVVAFDVGGIRDWLRDGVDGYLVTPGDVDELAHRIQLLLSDPLLRAAMGMSGRDSVLRQYPSARHADRLVSVFGSLICDAQGFDG